MLLPNGERAVVELEKLTDYCLNPEHARGKHKARVFAAALGIDIANAELLRFYAPLVPTKPSKRRRTIMANGS